MTAVGDPFQAIYGWRGAAASNILTFADLPPAGRRPAPVSPSPSTGAAAGPSSTWPTCSAARCAPATRAGDNRRRAGPLEPPDGARPARSARRPSRPGPRRSPGSRPGRRPCGRRQAERWADIAVLTRRNADIAPLYGELTAREVPVEIVGLGGLLHLPEVMDVTATLRLIDDVTANPDLIRLLTGPRWRDRAARPGAARPAGARSWPAGRGADARRAAGRGPGARCPGAGRGRRRPDRGGQPARRPGEPGRGAVLRAARERFARLAAELGYLRRHPDEPVLDLARRVIATLGPGHRAAGHPGVRPHLARDQLGAFLDAVAAYVDVDGDASLSGPAGVPAGREVEQGAGLDQAVPSDREAVKLLTVHKAKGLEWEVGVPARADAGHLPQRPGDRQLGHQPRRAARRPAR